MDEKFDFNVCRARTRYEKGNKFSKVSRTPECDVVRPTTKVSIVELTDNDITAKTSVPNQVNEIVGKSNLNNIEVGKHLEKIHAEFHNRREQFDLQIFDIYEIIPAKGMSRISSKRLCYRNTSSSFQ